MRVKPNPASPQVVIRCKACGWHERVAKTAAHASSLFHRDVTCAERLQPATRASKAPRSTDTLRSGKKPPLQRVGAPRKRFCPTCRGELTRINDAWKCDVGCTNDSS